MEMVWPPEFYRLPWHIRAIGYIAVAESRNPDEKMETVNDLIQWLGNPRGDSLKIAKMVWPDLEFAIDIIREQIRAKMDLRVSRRQSGSKGGRAIKLLGVSEKPVKAEAKPKKIQVLTPKGFLDGLLAPSFERLWKEWPKRGDGIASRGDRTKGAVCFRKIVDAQLATPLELEECVKAYSTSPKVLDGYVQQVSTFFSFDEGKWIECLQIVRKSGKKLQESTTNEMLFAETE